MEKTYHDQLHASVTTPPGTPVVNNDEPDMPHVESVDKLPVQPPAPGFPELLNFGSPWISLTSRPLRGDC